MNCISIINLIGMFSTLGSSALNIVDTWCDMSENSTFKSWQTAMNWISIISNGLYSIGAIYNSLTAKLANVGKGGTDVLNNLKPQNLMDELASSGVKYNPDEVIAVTKTADGKLVWLENGTDTAGLKHIITEHADDFLNKGITQEQIPDYVMNALENGKIVGYQGRGIGRPIYEFIYNGEIQKIAITVGNNGFVVGANPK